MKSRTIGCLALVASLGFGSVAMAQPDRDGRRDRRDNEQHQQDGRGNDRQRNESRNDNRNDNRNWDRDNRRGQTYGARGPEWRRGGHLPREYRNRQYVVNDWRGHHLSAPPRGQQWVQVGGDYVLASIATGVIVQLLLNN
jgi:Ni/Co efflux regulator RcnB